MKDVVCPKCDSVNDYWTRTNTFSDGTDHIEAMCENCGSHIKFLPHLDKPKTYLWFGKYEGKHTYEIDDLNYLKWLRTVVDDERLKLGIENRIQELQGGNNGQ